MIRQNPRDSLLIEHVHEGMNVFYADGNHLGCVVFVRLPNPTAFGDSNVASGDDEAGLVDGTAVNEGESDSTEPSKRLRQTGYLRINARGLFSQDKYVGAEHIESVKNGQVTLTVSKHVI